jgi:HEAT repeat protein
MKRAFVFGGVLVLAAGAAIAGKNSPVSPKLIPNTTPPVQPLDAPLEDERAAFEAALASPDPAVRAAAVRKVEDDDDWAMPFLIRAADDPAGDVRLAVALALEELGGDDRAEAAFEKLVRDPLPIVRTLACRAVAASRGQRLGEALRDALEDQDPAVRTAATVGLAARRDPRFVADLARRLEDGVAGVRVAAAAALGEIGDGSAAAPLRARLAEAPPNERRALEAALGRVH